MRSDQTQDNRVPARPLALAKSDLSYIDIHLYPQDTNTMPEDLRSIEFNSLRRECQQSGKPLLMGEFGAFKHSYPTLDAAACAMTQHARRALDAGFQGFLYWTYDSDGEIWNAKSGNGKLLKALSEVRPAYR